MTTLTSLNRRHKAGLLLVLAATGVGLLLDASAKQTMGIVLLGLAATWFVGSVAVRTLGIILSVMTFCVGLYLVAMPVWNERESVRSAAQEYDAALAAIREAVHDQSELEKYRVKTPKAEHDQFGQFGAPEPLKIPPGAVVLNPVQIPQIALKWVRPNSPDVIVSDYDTEFGFPDKMAEQDIMREIETKNLVPRPTFSMRAAIASHRIACLGGGSLSLLGLSGSVFLIWQARKAKLRVPAATQV